MVHRDLANPIARGLKWLSNGVGESSCGTLWLEDSMTKRIMCLTHQKRNTRFEKPDP